MGKINILLLTTEKNYLVSGGSDGTVFMNKIKRFDEGIMRREEPFDSQIDIAEEDKEGEEEIFPWPDEDMTDLIIRGERILKVNSYSLVSWEREIRVWGEIKDLDFHI